MIDRVEELLNEHSQHEKREEVIEHAKQLGTYNADDRSRQYPLDNPKALTNAVNKAWTKVHSCERRLAEKEKVIAHLLRKLDRANTHLWIVSGCVVAEGSVILFLAKELFARLH